MSQRHASWRVIGCKGCGSVIVEAALTLAGIPFEHEEVDYSASGPAKDRLLAHNPLGQVPTVILPNGTAMTETAALIFYIDDIAKAAALVPPSDAAERPGFLRWLVFFVAAVYPTFTYGDDAKRWVGDAAAPQLRKATDEHRQELWREIEAAAREPWFLGARFSALDLYVGIMTRWRPGRSWFTKRCPRLTAIAGRIDDHPQLAALLTQNFE